MRFQQSSSDYIFRNNIRKNCNTYPFVFLKTDNGFRAISSPVFLELLNFSDPQILDDIDNLLSDGDMQSVGVAAWQSIGTTQYRKEMSSSFSFISGSPKQCLFVYQNTQDGGIKQTISVLPGEQYTGVIEAQVAYAAVLPSNAINLFLYDETNGRPISELSILTNAFGGPRQITTTAKVPRGCYSLSLRITFSRQDSEASIRTAVLYKDEWNYSYGIKDRLIALKDSGSFSSGLSLFNNDVLQSFTQTDSREVSVQFSNVNGYFSNMLSNYYARELLIDRHSVVGLMTIGVNFIGRSSVAFQNIYSGKCLRYILTSDTFSVYLRES